MGYRVDRLVRGLLLSWSLDMRETNLTSVTTEMMSSRRRTLSSAGSRETPSRRRIVLSAGLVAALLVGVNHAHARGPRPGASIFPGKARHGRSLHGRSLHGRSLHGRSLHGGSHRARRSFGGRLPRRGSLRGRWLGSTPVRRRPSRRRAQGQRSTGFQRARPTRGRAPLTLVRQPARPARSARRRSRFRTAERRLSVPGRVAPKRATSGRGDFRAEAHQQLVVLEADLRAARVTGNPVSIRRAQTALAQHELRVRRTFEARGLIPSVREGQPYQLGGLGRLADQALGTRSGASSGPTSGRRPSAGGAISSSRRRNTFAPPIAASGPRASRTITTPSSPRQRASEPVPVLDLLPGD